MFATVLLASCCIAAGVEIPVARPMTPSVVVAALALNRDGSIDANEINHAPESLAGLDRNGDGMLSRDEFRNER
jgi:hypothetical protein